MRERYLEAYDAIRIDCLNGDKYKTGKATPDGSPDPSIFSTDHNREGIQVGTAIATLIRKQNHTPAAAVEFRNLWGAGKRHELLDTAEADAATLYHPISPPLELGLPFVSALVGDGYFHWVSLPDLFPASFPGVKTSRDEFLVDIDPSALAGRIADYFSPAITNDDIRARFPQVMATTEEFDPIETRGILLKRGQNPENIIRYAYRPFDLRWIYWEPETKLLDRNRADLVAARVPNLPDFVIPRAQRKTWSPPLLVSSLSDLNAMDGGASVIPSRIGASEYGATICVRKCVNQDEKL